MSGDWAHGLFGCFDDFTVCELHILPMFAVAQLSRNRYSDLLRSMLYLWKDR